MLDEPALRLVLLVPGRFGLSPPHIHVEPHVIFVCRPLWTDTRKVHPADCIGAVPTTRLHCFFHSLFSSEEYCFVFSFYRCLCFRYSPSTACISLPLSPSHGSYVLSAWQLYASWKESSSRIAGDISKWFSASIGQPATSDCTAPCCFECSRKYRTNDSLGHLRFFYL